MRHAPSVNYPVGRSPFEAALLLGLAAAAALVLLAWQLHSPVPLPPVALCGLWLLLALLGWRHWRRAPQGCLCWQAGSWHFEPLDGQGRPAQAVPMPPPQVRLDLQGVLLLQLPGHAPGWLWLARRSAPAQWLALRRAVHARAPVAWPASQPATAPGPGGRDE